jgi:hypothetical protein
VEETQLVAAMKELGFEVRDARFCSITGC